jgi:hypothetical protein
MRFVPIALAGAITVAFAQIAVAQNTAGTAQYPSANDQNRQQNMPHSQQENGRYSSNDRYENNGASAGQSRDRDEERHDNGKHKGQYKNGRGDDRQARGDDDNRGRSGRD